MSDTAHSVPGQSILERLYARGAVRPHIGASSAFYDRLGLSDPWTEFRGWTPAEADPDGMFFFLSAAPYYARLRTQRQKDWRARRRLLMRLSDPMPSLTERSARRMSGTVTLGAASMAVEPRVSQLAWTGDAAMVALVSAMAPTEAAPEKRRRRGVVTEQAVDVLREVVRITTGRTRRVLVKIIEDASALPAEEQIVVARAVARQLRGPAARVARADLAVADDASPLKFAADRAEPAANRRRSLRTVMASSPTMLAFEEPAVAPAQPARRRPAKVPPAAPSAYREIPTAKVAREVRTQRVTGRAGPEETLVAAVPARPRRRPTQWVATLARETRRTATSDNRYGLDAVRRPVRRGTARVALRAAEVFTEPRHGAIIAPSPTRYLRRVIEIPITVAAEGPAPTERALTRLVAARVRPSRLIAAPPTAYVQPIGAEPVAGPVARRERPVRRTVAAVERAAPVRRTPTPTVARPVRGAEPEAETPTTGRPSRRKVTRPRIGAEPPAIEATETPAPGATRVVPSRVRPAPTPVFIEAQAEEAEVAPAAPRRRRSSTLHAIDRSEPVARRERVLAAPAVVARFEDEAPEAPSTAPTRPTVRAVERLTATTDHGRTRVSLATRPTSYVDQVVRPVVEEAPPAEAPKRRHGRPTTRAASRVERSARADSRGVALLTTGPTDYLDVADAAEGPIARRPLRRVRPMHVPALDTDTLAEPIGVVAEPVRRTPSARVAERLDDARAEKRRVRPAPVLAPVVDEEPAERMLVRDARGRVRPSRRFAAGAAAYASARLLALAAEESAVAVPAEKARRRLRTPLERQAVSRRRLPRPMPHTIVASDARWLIPDVAPAVRVVAQRRVTGAGAVSSDRLADVLRRVSSAVRAVDRADDSRLLLPVAQRGLENAKVVTRRRAPLGEQIVLRIVIDEEAPAPVVRAERRGTLRDLAQPGASKRPLRRELGPAMAMAEGRPARPTEQAATRADDKPRPARRTAAHTVRTADGRYRPSPSRLPIAEADRLVRPERAVPPVPARRPRRAEEGTLAAPEAVEEGRSRPLGRTLDYVGGQRKQRRPVGPDLTLPTFEDDDDAPAWADRAVRGTAAKRRRRDLDTEQIAEGRGRDLFNALARASRPEDIVQVIVERGERLRGDVEGLPAPAVRLVERIARVQSEAAHMTVAPEGDLLNPQTREMATASGVRMSTIPQPRSKGTSPSAVRKVQTLADKLMKLIHLAEVERKVTEAQRQVRMATEMAEAKAEGGLGAAMSKPGDAPNIKQLESDVLAAVLRELDLMKIRRQEDIYVWW